MLSVELRDADTLPQNDRQPLGRFGFRFDIHRHYRHSAAHRHQHHARLELRGTVVVADVSLGEHRNHLAALEPRDDLAEGRKVRIVSVNADTPARLEQRTDGLVHDLLADDEKLPAVRHSEHHVHGIVDARVVRYQKRAAADFFLCLFTCIYDLRPLPEHDGRACQPHKVVSCVFEGKYPRLIWFAH